MTPAELRSLADEATPGPWGRALTSNLPGDGPVVKNLEFFDWVATVQVSNTPEWRENARLIALAPDLARLCAEYAGAFEQIEKLHPKDRAESAHIARRALAKLSELESR